MATTKTKAPRDWREERRRRAWALKQQGWRQRRIAEALGVTEGAVSQWLKRARDGGGVEALQAQVAPGPTPKLTEAQQAQVPALLRKGAEYYGFMGAIWTTKRVAEVIRRHFGVRYHPDHVRKLLHRWRWSVQQPVQRASQRNEAAIQTWLEDEWPRLKRGRKRRSAPWSGLMKPASGSCRA